MQPHDFILLISGTNRPDSSTLRVAQRIEELYRQAQVRCEMLSLEQLPLEIFSPQAYAQKPSTFRPLQEKVLDAGGLHVVLPEYNGSFPGVLKYFIDLLKFPESCEQRKLGRGAGRRAAPVGVRIPARPSLSGSRFHFGRAAEVSAGRGDCGFRAA
jgi:NAD(P)H-dependent FMN reductase